GECGGTAKWGVRPGDAGEGQPRMRGEEGGALRGWRERHRRWYVACPLDEVRHRVVKGGGDLEQRGDRRNHVVSLDLVDRRGRHLGLDRERLQREPLLLAELLHLRADGTDDLLDVLLLADRVRRGCLGPGLGLGHVRDPLDALVACNIVNESQPWWAVFGAHLQTEERCGAQDRSRRWGSGR